MNRRLVILVLLVLAVGAGLWGQLSSPQAPTPPAVPDHEAPPHSMQEFLRQLAERAPDENAYTGSKKARGLREALASLPQDAPVQQRAQLLQQSSQAELRLGNVRRAVDQFEEALRLVSDRRSGFQAPPQWYYEGALANLQLGERQNCCYENNADSCIFPIQNQGVHKHPAGARRAANLLSTVVQRARPGTRLHGAALWLLNVAHMALGTWPQGVPPSLRINVRQGASTRPFPRFRNIGPELGIDAFDMAGGALVEDLDGDGFLDILTSSWDPTAPMHFYRNVGGGSFEEITRAAGLADQFGGLNLIQADYDNDGDTDVFVLRGAWLAEEGQHPNSLLQNDGKGRFTDVTFAAGLALPAYPSQTAAWADYDADGDLDLYVGNETTGGFLAPCQLFRNKGDGTFEEVAEQAGVRNLGWTKGVAWGDYDGDGWPDLYVSNLVGKNRLYHNKGDGSFEDVGEALGVTGPIQSFPLWFWDFDNDGRLDLFVPSYDSDIDQYATWSRGQAARYEPPRLYRNVGNGRFEDVAQKAGLVRPMTPMGCNFGDLDGDGWLDFYLGNGDIRFEALIPNQMFCGNGSSFDDVTVAGGFGHLQKGHGIAFADIDQDGDCDVFSQLGGAYPGDKFKNALYENPGFGHAFVTVEVSGRQSNRSGIGARIHVRTQNESGAQRSVFRTVGSGASFGANPLRQTIGLGDATRVLFIEVLWPTTGKTQRFEAPTLGGSYRAIEGEDALQDLALKAYRLGRS